MVATGQSSLEMKKEEGVFQSFSKMEGRRRRVGGGRISQLYKRNEEDKGRRLRK
jgi:hypothetical protein